MDEINTPTDPLQTPGTRLDIGEIREHLANKKGQAYWRSLEELSDTPEFNEFLQKEFPASGGAAGEWRGPPRLYEALGARR